MSQIITKTTMVPRQPPPSFFAPYPAMSPLKILFIIPWVFYILRTVLDCKNESLLRPSCYRISEIDYIIHMYVKINLTAHRKQLSTYPFNKIHFHFSFPLYMNISPGCTSKFCPDIYVCGVTDVHHPCLPFTCNPAGCIDGIPPDIILKF